MAAELAEQIRGAVEYKTGVTTSIGVAHAPCESAQVNTLLSRADTAKALAQQKGRNRVEMVSMSMRLPSVPSDGDSP
jgi:GGDEF domain-containing protein